MRESAPRRSKFATVLFICFGLVIAAASYYQRKCLIADTQTRTVEVTYKFSIADVNPDAGGIKIWVPIPLTNGQQRLLGTELPEGLSYEIVTESKYGNRYLLFNLSRDGLPEDGELAMAIKYTVRRDAVCPLEDGSSVPKIERPTLSHFLVADDLVPIDGIVAEEASKTVGQIKGQLAQANALYENIVKTVKYDKSGEGWGRGDAIYACDIRKGNCTDFHSLFIGQVRSLGIPARFIMGVPIPHDKTEGEIGGYHCWAEFYVDGKGWLPVDASEASKYPEEKSAYFGQLDSNRVAFTIGRDIKIPQSNSEAINYSIYPHVEIDGETYNKVKTSFSFKDKSKLSK
jgi:transglutaminase-like putative cysteine protease